MRYRPLHPADEPALIVRAQAGDEEAQIRLLEAGWGLIMGLVHALAPSNLREDATSVAVMAYLRGIQGFDRSRTTRLSSYALESARRALITERRRGARHLAAVPLDPGVIEAYGPRVEPHEPSETVFILWIKRQIRHLEPAERYVLQQSIRGRNNQEIGRDLDLSREWVRRLKRRAVRKLRRRINRRSRMAAQRRTGCATNRSQ